MFVGRVSRNINSSLNAENSAIFIDDILKEFNIKRENFILLLTDAAPYMLAAGRKFEKYV